MNRIIQIVPAAPGWRVFYLHFDGDDPETASDHQLFFSMPVACFALVEEEDDGETYRTVEPLTTYGSGYRLSLEEGETIALLGPGESDRHVRGSALERLKLRALYPSRS